MDREESIRDLKLQSYKPCQQLCEMEGLKSGCAISKQSQVYSLKESEKTLVIPSKIFKAVGSSMIQRQYENGLDDRK